MDEVGLSDLNQVLLAESRGVVIDFWGTWCSPCRSLRPHLEKLATETSDDWHFVAVHVESHEDVVEKYQVMSTPTLIFIKGGDEVHRIAGAMTPSTVSEALSAYA